MRKRWPKTLPCRLNFPCYCSTSPHCQLALSSSLPLLLYSRPFLAATPSPIPTCCPAAPCSPPALASSSMAGALPRPARVPRFVDLLDGRAAPSSRRSSHTPHSFLALLVHHVQCRLPRPDGASRHAASSALMRQGIPRFHQPF